MRIAFISDLHTDLSRRNRELLEPLVDVARRLEPDVFVLVGDLAETLEQVEESLRQLAPIPGRKLYVAGNHDLFVEGDPSKPGVASSREKFETLLPAIAARAGFEYLGLEPTQVHGVGFVGIPGWYDFSLRDPSLDGVSSEHAYDTGQWRGNRAYDRGHVFWPRNAALDVPGMHPASHGGRWAGDREIALQMQERLEAQLQRLHSVSHLVAAIHVVPCLEMAQRHLFGDTTFFDAYLGSARLGARLLQEPRLRLVLSGHLHRQASLQIAGIPFLASPVGDARKSPLDLASLARERLGLVEIDPQPGPRAI